MSYEEELLLVMKWLRKICDGRGKIELGGKETIRCLEKDSDVWREFGK